jgi:hypothetical protein
LQVPTQLKHGAEGTTVITLDGRAPRAAKIDKALVRAIVRAHHWRELLKSGEARTAYDLARHEECRVSYVQRHLPLAFLSPELVEAIIDGKQPSWCVLSELLQCPRSGSWHSHNGAILSPSSGATRTLVFEEKQDDEILIAILNAVYCRQNSLAQIVAG